MKSEMEQLIDEIKKVTETQTSINKADELRVMTTMLNDPDFSIGIYDKKLGYIGQKSPHDEAVKFVGDIIQRTTGLEKKDSQHLAEGLEFTKRDASFLLTNMRDFLSVYTSAGRKINIMQSAATEANLYAKEMPASTKTIPNKDNPGESKTITTSPYIKLVSQSKCPKYNEED
jgi:hypothetical protein